MACCKSRHNCTLEFIDFLKARRSDLRNEQHAKTNMYGQPRYRHADVAILSGTHTHGEGEVCNVCYETIAQQKDKEIKDKELAILMEKIDMITTLLGDEGY